MKDAKIFSASLEDVSSEIRSSEVAARVSSGIDVERDWMIVPNSCSPVCVIAATHQSNLASCSSFTHPTFQPKH
jgi:hypothetical protein